MENQIYKRLQRSFAGLFLLFFGILVGTLLGHVALLDFILFIVDLISSSVVGDRIIVFVFGSFSVA